MSVTFAVENLMNILHTEVFQTFEKANWLELSRVRKIRGKEVSFGSIYLEFRKTKDSKSRDPVLYMSGCNSRTYGH